MSEESDYELIVNDERGEEFCRLSLSPDEWGCLIQLGLTTLLREAVAEREAEVDFVPTPLGKEPSSPPVL